MPGGKRKRKLTDGRKGGGASDDENGASGSDMARATAQQLVDLKKRTKTVRPAVYQPNRFDSPFSFSFNLATRL